MQSISRALRRNNAVMSFDNIQKRVKTVMKKRYRKRSGIQNEKLKNIVIQ